MSSHADFASYQRRTALESERFAVGMVNGFSVSVVLWLAIVLSWVVLH